MPSLPPGLRIYAIGDIHGRADLLAELHDLIRTDLTDAPDRTLLVYLGDYIDRGMESREVIAELIREPLPGAESIHLIGNHEQLMLDAMDGDSDGALWRRNGGEATLQSYGLEPDLLGHALSMKIPPTHRQFLRGLKLQARFGDYFFVHAGVFPGRPLAEQQAEDMLWIRDRFLNSDADHGAVVVHGHTPTDDVEWRPNRIGIDTGAYWSGRLTALALEGAERRLLQTAGATSERRGNRY